MTTFFFLLLLLGIGAPSVCIIAAATDRWVHSDEHWTDTVLWICERLIAVSTVGGAIALAAMCIQVIWF